MAPCSPFPLFFFFFTHSPTQTKRRNGSRLTLCVLSENKANARFITITCWIWWNIRTFNKNVTVLKSIAHWSSLTVLDLDLIQFIWTEVVHANTVQYEELVTALRLSITKSLKPVQAGSISKTAAAKSSGRYSFTPAGGNDQTRSSVEQRNLILILQWVWKQLQDWNLNFSCCLDYNLKGVTNTGLNIFLI